GEAEVPPGVEPGGEEGGRDLAGLVAQLRRVLPGGDGVHVDDAIEAVELVLQLHPVADGTEIVAEMQVAGRLDAGEDAVDWSHRGSRSGGGAVIACAAGGVKRPAVRSAGGSDRGRRGRLRRA